jgi:hypothetical protein
MPHVPTQPGGGFSAPPESERRIEGGRDDGRFPTAGDCRGGLASPPALDSDSAEGRGGDGGTDGALGGDGGTDGALGGDGGTDGALGGDGGRPAPAAPPDPIGGRELGAPNGR